MKMVKKSWFNMGKGCKFGQTVHNMKVDGMKERCKAKDAIFMPIKMFTKANL